MNENRPQRPPRPDAGFVLYIALLLLLVVGATSGFFLYAAFNNSRTVRRWHESDQCLLDAQSALERVKYEMVQAYLSNQVSSADALGWFQTWTLNSIGNNPEYTIPSLDPINGSAVKVTIAGVRIITNSGYAEVELVGAAGRSPPYAVTRLVNETLRITALDLPQPFDYAYLLDNSGRLQNNTVINGDIRINGNYRLNNSSLVNGNRYAAGQITANAPLWSVADYWSTANTTPSARPTDPTGAGLMAWPMGYSPDKSKSTYMAAYALPSLGDFASLAAIANGRIVQGTNTIVNTYSGPGPDGLAGTADDGCLVLDGSVSPIAIQGAVAVRRDLIIRGKVKGQGTMYAGRNVHIVGGLTYVNPPAWPKPDSTPEQTAANNASKDILVLAAKGNVVVGNYTAATWSNRVWSILTDPAKITPEDVSDSDAALGYDSDNNPANGYFFDGRYYVDEVNNGRRLSGAGTNTVPRKYYESSLAHSTFAALCDANNVPAIHAALFGNRGIIGNLGSSASGGNTVLNGAMVCHDDLTAFYGSFTINWDIRLGSKSKDRINTSFLSVSGNTGGVAAVSSTIGWREIH